MADVIQVTVREGLWSEEVARANADAGVIGTAPDTGYEFSNGRRFVDGPGAYAPPVNGQ